MRRFPSPTFLLCLACAAVVAAPLWLHRWLPIQDLPQHLAALRVVHDVHTGAKPAADLYVTHLGSTQYLLFYVVGDLLAYVVDVRTAALLLLSAYMLGTVAALYALLRSLGRDPRLSLLVVPLLTNSMLFLGLIQFVIGIPLMFWGWSLAIETLRTGRRRTAIALAVVAVLVFYSHVVVFGVFGIGLAVVAPWSSPRRLARYALLLVPAGVAAIYWAFFTASGAFVRGAITSGTENKDLWPFWVSCRAMYEVAFDTYRDSGDEKLFAMFVATAAALTTLARRGGARAPIPTARWLLVSVACAVLYFRSEGTNGFLGHIRDRFALLAVLAVLPTFRMPRGLAGHLGTVAMVALSGLTARTLQAHLTRFERADVGDFDAALAHLEPGRRVAGLIFQPDSASFGQSPFLHYASYYLVDRGGTVNFSFAGYPHWVYAYRPHEDALGESPPVFLWEWQPARLRREDLVGSYDYVLTRGPGFDAPDEFRKAWEGTDWAVWERCHRPVTPAPVAAGAPAMRPPGSGSRPAILPFAGIPGGRGDLDGAGTEARIGVVAGMARVGDAIVFADEGNGSVRRFEPATGRVTTLARLPRVEPAVPSLPWGVAYDGADGVYVADRSAHVVYELARSTGDVTVALGRPGVRGDVDGDQGQALLDSPSGLAFSDGILYVADVGNRRVRRVDLRRRTVGTLAGGFMQPWGLCVAGGSLFVADSLEESVFRVDLASGTSSLVAGSGHFGYAGRANGPPFAARFRTPRGIDCSSDAVFVADHADDQVRRIDRASGEVTLLAGSNMNGAGYRDGQQGYALFRDVQSTLRVGDTVFVGDQAALRAVSLGDAVVRTAAGAGETLTLDVDFVERGALLGPEGIAVSVPDGAAFVAGGKSPAVYRLDLVTGATTVLAGHPQAHGFVDAWGIDARFGAPSAIASDDRGTLFVGDRENHAVRAVTIAAGKVTTVAGTPGVCGNADGPLREATFCDPEGLAFGQGALFVADASTQTIRRVDLASGRVSTLAGEPFVPGDVDGVGRSARFSSPTGLALVGDGLFVADRENGSVRRIDVRTGQVTTLGPRFDRPAGLASSGGDGLLVLDAASVDRLSLADGKVARLFPAGRGLRTGDADPSLGHPAGIVQLSPGDALVVDRRENAVVRLAF